MSTSTPEEEISWVMSMQIVLAATKPSHTLTLAYQVIFLGFYCQLIKWVKPSTYQSVEKWSYRSLAGLFWVDRPAATQDNNISPEVYTSSVTSYISKHCSRRQVKCRTLVSLLQCNVLLGDLCSWQLCGCSFDMQNKHKPLMVMAFLDGSALPPLKC